VYSPRVRDWAHRERSGGSGPSATRAGRGRATAGTTRLRLVQRPVICFTPVYVAESLFRSEGFTDVAYLKKLTPSENYQALASGEADMNFGFGPPLIARIDAGDPIVFIAGGHVGCLQLFGTDHVRTLR
jgi:NitT/TauT family transport system substrate-binding protein